ncbi:PBP1A family penicillin-binding protein [Candidatus Daviesbacteria bacterium]|nr:PBP1A family penicillin-binding protein [Candidatus Daviesbacteria bacterium]
MILIKIGNIPLWLIRLLVGSLWFVIKSTLSLRIPSVPVPQYQISHRKRGRPRKVSFLYFHFRRFKRFIKRHLSLKVKLALTLSVVVLILFLYTSFILTAAYQLPSPNRLISQNQPLTTEFYDRNDQLLYRLYEGRNRTLVTLDELPKYLIQATIASEDKNFYSHIGFDPSAIARAVYYNLTEGRQEGASTITQQLIKNSLLTPEKTYVRKIKELILAFWAERIYSKNDILQMYFNEAPYGGPAWGIEAAARTYFGKGAKDLTLAESAFLAGLPASPTQFSPYGNNQGAAKNRQDWVLQRMVEEGYLTEEQRLATLAEPLNLRPASNNILAPHFVFYVRDYLAQKYGFRVVSQGGLKIYTTLDLNIQKQAEKIVAEELMKLTPLNVNNGAAMITDARSGQILAMVGSRDYHYPEFGNFNVTIALRQPGSSIKPATYATAFKLGFSPGNTILDSPVSFKDGSKNYSPKNYDSKFHGPVSIRTALGSSYNVPAVKMLATVGIPQMIETARSLGITTFNDPNRFGLSLTLGGGEVRMIDMMSMYGAFSQMGQLNSPTSILKVTDSSGNILEEYEKSSHQAIDGEFAYLISHILSDNKARTPAFGSNSLLNIPGQFVAVKTGTSDNKRDNWTFGYTDDFVIGVWVGNNDNSAMNQTLASGVTGAAPIWRRITDYMLTLYPSSAFVKPIKIAEGIVDGRRDLIISDSVPKSLVRVRKEEDKTIFSDAFSSFATPSAQAAVKNEATN